MIAFNIPGTPPYSIALRTPLPFIISPVIIDGSTQPGYASQPIIEINGSQAGANADGIYLLTGSSGSTVRSLVVNGFALHGIISTASSNTVQNCFVGTDLTGTKALGNGSGGITVEGGHCLIGGPGNLLRNLISGNGASGINVYGTPATVIQGNSIGTDISGTHPLGNSDDGIQVARTSSGSSDGTVVGGTAPEVGNIIAYNGRTGVWIGQGLNSPVLGNSIYGNAGIGIDLGNGYQYPDGPTTNHVGGAASGPNGLQNYPVLTSVTDTGTSVTVQGTVNSAPNMMFRLEFFSNPGAAYRFTLSEGKVLLTWTNLTTDSFGNASFVFSLPAGTANVTATATDTNGNTSEFSTVSLSPPQNPAPQSGDFFVGVGYGKIQWRRADGTPVRLLDTAQGGQYSPSGLAIDPLGNLYAGTSDGQSVVKFDVTGNALGSFGPALGDLVNGVESDGLGNILAAVGAYSGLLFKLNPAGEQLAVFSLSSTRFVFDLGADQRTLSFASFAVGGQPHGVLRYDLATEMPLPPLVQNLSGPSLADLRLLPDGGFVAANVNNVSRYDARGVLVTALTSQLVGGRLVRLDPDGKSVWIIGSGPYLYKVDLATGALLNRLYIEYTIPGPVYGPTQLGPGTALAVRGEPSAASGAALIMNSSPNPAAVGQSITYQLIAVNNTLSDIAAATVTDPLPSSVSFSQATTRQGTFSQAGNTVTFSLGTLSHGATATMTITALASAPGVITNTASLAGAGLDPQSSNYTALAHTLVANGPLSPFTVLTTDDSGPGSLRAVMQLANAATNSPTITFNIPGPGVHAIQPLTALPILTATVTIDGYSQPGASPNTLAQGDDAVLLVAVSVELILYGDESTVRGLSVASFYLGGSAITLQGNFIGVDSTGTNKLPNSSGIYLNESFDHQIGGRNPADRNLISGNTTGISGYGAPNPIFPPGPSYIQGNYIGTDRSGAAPLGNTNYGIEIIEPLQVIGGTNNGEGNVIAFNGHGGVALTDRSDNVEIEGNSIFSNGGPGIDGANPGPVITGAAPGSTAIQGLLQATAGEPNRVEVFANLICSGSGYGQGQTFLGAVTVTPDASGSGVFSIPTSLPLVAGQVITATSTPLPDGTTSGFSRCVTVEPSVDLGLFGSASSSSVAALSNVTYLVTITNHSDLPATGVLLTCLLPLSLKFISASAGCSNHSGTVTCLLSSLAGGASFSATITAQPQIVGVTTASFLVVADEPDANPANNVALVMTTAVNPSPRLLVVTNNLDSGPGSLNQAITDVNNGVGGDTISFHIPGPGVHTIQSSYLSSLNVPVTVDGYTQPGSSPNTLSNGDNAVLLLDLGAATLDLTGGNSLVRGLVVRGITLESAGNGAVEGCFIGTDPTGHLPNPNGGHGVQISGSDDNRIGGPGPAARNLISGNGFSVGYLSPGIQTDSARTIIQGNYIGTDITGSGRLGNAAGGVSFNGLPQTGGFVGGTNPGAGNVIAFNDGPGVLVVIPGHGQSVLGNSIYGNSGIGIDLGNLNGSVNDAPFTNSVSGVLNPPVITNLVSGASSTTVQGYLQSAPNLAYRLEFFSSPPPTNAFYFSEGESYLGFASVTTDAHGQAVFTVGFPGAFPLVSATATDPDGSTSAFFMFPQPDPGCVQRGDLFIGFSGDGHLQWRRANGRPVAVIFHGGFDSISDLALSLGGVLVAADQSTGNLERFGSCAQSLGAIVTGTNTTPNALSFDASGNLYVGLFGPTNNVWKYDASARLVAQYTLALQNANAGVDSMDLAADQHTLYYLSQGSAIQRFDLAANQQLPDLVTNLVGVSALRLLPVGGLLTSASGSLFRLGASGDVVWSNTVPAIYAWYSLRLDPAGQSFWAAGSSTAIGHFDLASGAMLDLFRADVSGNALSLAILGEPTAAAGGTVQPSLSIALEGNELVIKWNGSATGFVLERSATLGPAASWQKESTQPALSAGDYVVRTPLPNANTYYRLTQ